MTSAAAAGPVPETGRILALDAARGFALLGILFVNIQFFAMPFGSFFQLDPPDGAANAAAHYFTKIFCQGKFYPLFSMMFGIGLVLQRQRAEGRGASFGGIYARRLLVLATLGALHGLFFWYGDILFMYAIVGFVLLLASRLPGRALILVGCGVLLWALLLIGAATALQGQALQAQENAQHRDTEATGELIVNEDGTTDLILSPEIGQSDPGDAASGGTSALSDSSDVPNNGESKHVTPEGGLLDDAARKQSMDNGARPPPAGPARELLQLYEDGAIQFGPEQPEHMRLETEAYRDGPYLDAFLFRAFSFFLILLVAAFGFGWTILASFFFGAGLYKLGLFERDKLRLVKLGALAGLGFGLPIVLVGQWALHSASPALAVPLMATTEAAGGIMMAFGYLCIMILLGHAGSPIAKLLAPMGRMALTCYLLQTLLATAIFYHWGLGRFGSMSRGEMVLVVLGIYIFEIGVAHLWLARFKMGPMEWLWRRLTYLTPVEIARESTARESKESS